ncbi:MAG: hypothetical protein L0220_22355 [Acidobacteria bacterium]|nr:hypothetical protein [Acidobacteriota bacterium]
MQEAVALADQLFENLAQQTQAYEIVSAEDKRERYLFFAGDTGDVAYSGGMRIDSRSIPRQTLYRCLVTPCVTVRRLELLNLIPDGAVIPGSADRIKTGCGEYWQNAGPEANSLIQNYGNQTDPGRNLGLVELAPDFLRGRDWDKEVKPLNLTKVFFPNWPNLPALHSEVIADLQERLIDVETTNDPQIRVNRELYLAVGRDMLRALEAAQQWSEWICNKTNQAVAQPHGDETHKRGFDLLDEICFKRSGMIKNTDALRRVAEEMKNRTNNGLSGDQLQQILQTVVPQQPAITPEMLAAAFAAAIPMALQMIQAQSPAPISAPTLAEPDTAEPQPKPKVKSGDTKK